MFLLDGLSNSWPICKCLRVKGSYQLTKILKNLFRQWYQIGNLSKTRSPFSAQKDWTKLKNWHVVIYGYALCLYLIKCFEVLNSSQTHISKSIFFFQKKNYNNFLFLAFVFVQYCLSMPNFLTFRPSHVRDFLKFNVPLILILS